MNLRAEYPKQKYSSLSRLAYDETFKQFHQLNSNWQMSKKMNQEILEMKLEKKHQELCPFKPNLNKKSEKIINEMGTLKGKMLKDSSISERQQYYDTQKEQKMKLIQSDMDKNLSFTPFTLEKTRKLT